MSAKSNQSKPNSPETEETQTTPLADQTQTGTTQEVIPPNDQQLENATPHFESIEGREPFVTPPIEPLTQGDFPNDKKEPVVTMSIAELQQLVADSSQKAVADALRQRDESNAVVAEAEKAQEKTSTWPYGNRDTKKEFDLSKHTNWKALPTDQIVAVNRAYNRDQKGNKIGVDVANSQIQVFEPLDFATNQRVTAGSGLSIYNMLGFEWEPLNVPEGYEKYLDGPALNQ